MSEEHFRIVWVCIDIRGKEQLAIPHRGGTLGAAWERTDVSAAGGASHIWELVRAQAWGTRNINYVLIN